jgi:uncharacterized membrane protein YkvA (DUF1232 family)
MAASSLQRARSWARGLKLEIYALYLAMRDNRTPWYARALAGVVVAYACSPIDLIPDFIPVLGYLDDLLITPLGLWLAIRLVPRQVMAEARTQAQAHPEQVQSLGRAGLVLTVTAWLLFLAGMLWLGRGIRDGQFRCANLPCKTTDSLERGTKVPKPAGKCRAIMPSSKLPAWETYWYEV